jgi:hypothetical protein
VAFLDVHGLSSHQAIVLRRDCTFLDVVVGDLCKLALQVVINITGTSFVGLFGHPSVASSIDSPARIGKAAQRAFGGLYIRLNSCTSWISSSRAFRLFFDGLQPALKDAQTHGHNSVSSSYDTELIIISNL